MHIPRFYPILDRSCFADSRALLRAAEDILSGGATLLQYRNKSGNARMMLEDASALKALAGSRATLIMNDRADLCVAGGFDGLHVGQDDLSPEAARRIIGNERWLGVSTHNPDQLREAGKTSADYLAIGPVFATATKANPDPTVGLEGVVKARSMTRKPLVAIGGITPENARSVIEAGADAVAVISSLLPDVRKSAEAFLRILR